MSGFIKGEGNLDGLNSSCLKSSKLNIFENAKFVLIGNRRSIKLLQDPIFNVCRRAEADLDWILLYLCMHMHFSPPYCIKCRVKSVPELIWKHAGSRPATAIASYGLHPIRTHHRHGLKSKSAKRENHCPPTSHKLSIPIIIPIKNICRVDLTSGCKQFSLVFQYRHRGFFFVGTSNSGVYSNINVEGGVAFLWVQAIQAYIPI